MMDDDGKREVLTAVRRSDGKSTGKCKYLYPNICQNREGLDKFEPTFRNPPQYESLEWTYFHVAGEKWSITAATTQDTLPLTG